MKWTFIIREKFKVALLLASIMLLVGLTTIMQRSNMEDLSRSFSTIYYDRLVPATDIFYLTQNLYNKQLAMEHLLYAETPFQESMTQELKIHNDSIHRLISKFEETYLVKEELNYLTEFKKRVDHYNKVEASILHALMTNSKSEAQKLYETEGKADLQQTMQFLGKLTKVQSSVGQDILKSSAGIVSSNDLVLTIQIVLAIVIGLLAEGLILSSRMVNRKQDQKFNLN